MLEIEELLRRTRELSQTFESVWFDSDPVLLRELFYQAVAIVNDDGRGANRTIFFEADYFGKRLDSEAIEKHLKDLARRGKVALSIIWDFLIFSEQNGLPIENLVTRLRAQAQMIIDPTEKAKALFNLVPRESMTAGKIQEIQAVIAAIELPAYQDFPQLYGPPEFKIDHTTLEDWVDSMKQHLHILESRSSRRSTWEIHSLSRLVIQAKDLGYGQLVSHIDQYLLNALDEVDFGSCTGRVAEELLSYLAEVAKLDPEKKYFHVLKILRATSNFDTPDRRYVVAGAVRVLIAIGKFEEALGLTGSTLETYVDTLSLAIVAAFRARDEQRTGQLLQEFRNFARDSGRWREDSEWGWVFEVGRLALEIAEETGDYGILLTPGVERALPSLARFSLDRLLKALEFIADPDFQKTVLTYLREEMEKFNRGQEDNPYSVLILVEQILKLQKASWLTSRVVEEIFGVN